MLAELLSAFSLTNLIVLQQSVRAHMIPYKKHYKYLLDGIRLRPRLSDNLGCIISYDSERPVLILSKRCRPYC